MSLDYLPRTPEARDINPERFRAEAVPAFRPIVLRGAVTDWPVVKAAAGGPDALFRYLAPFVRPGTAVETWLAPPAFGGRFGYDGLLTGFAFDRMKLPLPQLFGALARSQGDPTLPSVYAGAIPLSEHLPGLIAQVSMPLAPPFDRLVSLWLSNGSRTATHWDLSQNLACVIAGERRFLLFPPDQQANLYMGPLDLTPAGQPIGLADPLAPDFERFPRLAEALRHAELAVLEPGDVLYLPAMWLHHVETPGRFGAQVNFWWRDAATHMASPFVTLLHALLTVRGLPAPEREVWREMFGRYVFGEGGDPAAHLPEDARGVLGPMTPGMAERLRRILAESLRS